MSDRLDVDYRVLFGRDRRHQSLSTSGSRSDIECDVVRAEAGKICPRRRRGGCLSPTFILMHGLPSKPILSSSRPREPLGSWLSAFNRDMFGSFGNGVVCQSGYAQSSVPRASRSIASQTSSSVCQTPLTASSHLSRRFSTAS